MKLDTYAPWAIAALRIVTALLFIEHGTQKLFAVPAAPPHGLPEVLSLFWVAGLLELVGGTLILVGFATRSVSFILSGQMAVAYWMVHARGSIFPILNGGDAAILFCFIFLTLVFMGPGAMSIDGARKGA